MSNILMVTERYIPIWGGAENQLRQLIPHLHARNYLVKVVTRRWHAELLKDDMVDDVAVIRLGIPGETQRARFIFICHLIMFLIWNGRNYDIFHSHGAVKMGVICCIASLITDKKNIVKIATAGKITSLQGSFPGRVLLYFFRKSDAVICMTREIEKELTDIGFPEEKIVRIPNAVDCERFFRQASSAERKRFRRRCNVPEDAFLFVFSGRLVYRKGLDILIEAWSEFISSKTDIDLLIIGSGKGQPDSIESEIKKQVDNDQISNIVFIGEIDDPESYLACCDGFVFPSRQEGFPNALMEAMAAELPVVASRIGGNVELIEHYRTGLLFDLKNRDELVQCLENLYGNQKLMSAVGHNARVFVEENFSFAKIASHYIQLYSQVV